MSTFVPFKAIRPIKEKVKEVASKPYDVVNEQEARKESEGNPISFYRVIKPEIEFPDDFDHHAPQIYQKGKENFDKLVEQGVMVQDAAEHFYAYQLEMKGHSQTGLVGCCSIDDYFNNVIKKHELTRPDKEEDRKNHIRESKLNYEAMIFSYRHVEAVDHIIEIIKKDKPVYDFTADDGVRHSLWVVNQPDLINKLVHIFDSQVPKIYIADGHHRTAAGALVGRELSNGNGKNGSRPKRTNFFMAALFPDNQLQILDYNRVVKDLNGLSQEEFMDRLSDNFEITKKDGPHRPDVPHTFGMYLNDSWYKLKAKKGTYDDNDPLNSLDVTVLSDYVLKPILNIVDLRTDERIDFVGGIRGLEELEKRVDSGEMTVAFALHPVSMQQLIDISDNDLIMPPKVTWFEPKLRSGLFVHRLEEN